MFAYKVGGSKNGLKHAYVMFEWSLIDSAHGIDSRKNFEVIQLPLVTDNIINTCENF